MTREDTVEAYQAYLSLFPAQVMSSRVREVLDRRRVMIAWYAATTIDTVASYEAFLAAYADTDLAPTARRLLERAKHRMQLASTSSICPCALSPGGRPIQQQQQQKQKPEQKATRSIDMLGGMNSGYSRKGKKLRCVGDRNEVRAFRTFAPFVYAMVGKPTGTFDSRTIAIELRRATPEKARALLSLEDEDAEDKRLTDMGRKAARWAVITVADRRAPNAADLLSHYRCQAADR